MQSNPIATMSPQGASSQSTTNKDAVLGKDDFLKILVGEMTNMNPMSSDNQDPTQSVAQMAQFSIVEQLTNLSQSSQKTSAMAMLGKTITYKDPASGDSTQGVVQSVDTSGGDPTLTVGDKSGIAIATVTAVQ
jgi:flagellar basal-body rod modification protein FlgD